MGRSPGKWIKTVLFGKKSSKSNLSKGRNDMKSSNEKEVLVSPKAPSAGLVVNPSLVPQTENGENSVLERSEESGLSVDGLVLVQGADNLGSTTSDLSDPERIRQEQAATKAQAAFRGYLARRAFRALMGIIRLQALVRGHLVRRQAVATLRCVRVIVKFQALVRAKKDAKVPKASGLSFIRAEKLLANSFISKLLGSSSNMKPLCLQYDPVEPNSSWNWLARWTHYRVWDPLPPSKKRPNSKPHSKPKRGVRRLSVGNTDTNNLTRSSSEKTARIMRKPKRNTSLPAATPDESETPKHKPSVSASRKSLSSLSPEVLPEPASPELVTENDDRKDENTPMANGSSQENQKTRRRASLPAKHAEYTETNNIQHSPKLPSYMQATESVKAKLRAQDSPKSVPDVADQNGLTRRLSLPASGTPRAQRPQANGKGTIKQDRSILSSKDGNEKVGQAEWKR
ncbi:IQ-domain [Ranunculus cassubicifolius]